MAAPTNISAASATDLGTLPASVTQNVHDAGTTYTVWYRYTAVSGDSLVGIWGYGGGTAYIPTTEVFLGPASSPVPYLGVSAQDVPAQIPVTAGVTYYFRFTRNSASVTPADLQISAIKKSMVSVPTGSIAVNDDTPGFPLALLDGTAAGLGEPLAFIQDFPAGEHGDIFDDGTLLIEDNTAGEVIIFDSNFSQIASFSTGEDQNFIRRSVAQDKWYFSYRPGSAPDPVVKTIDATGAIGPTTWTITPLTLAAPIAPSPDETILYYKKSSGAIGRWDLNTDSALSDLVAADATHLVINDILTLDDGSVLVGYIKNTVTRSYFVKRYSAAGATLNTYTFTTEQRLNRMCYAIDSPASFWVWIYDLDVSGSQLGTSTFLNVRVSDGVILTDSGAAQQYEGGIYQGDPTASPVRFGHSFSCPFWITRDMPSGGSIQVVKVTIPASDTTAFDFTASGGLSPTSLSLSGGESYAYDGLPAGDGYSVTETPNSAYATTVTVSNGSPNTNIEVGEDETVVVTFTNSQVGTMNFDVVPIKRRWLRRSPIYTQEQKRTRWSKFVLAFQAGMGNTVEPGVDPQVFMRYSGDWGQTWSSTRQVTAGKKGQYNAQVQWWNLGVQRQMVIEIYGSDPCPVYISDAYAELEGGTD